MTKATTLETPAQLLERLHNWLRALRENTAAGYFENGGVYDQLPLAGSSWKDIVLMADALVVSEQRVRMLEELRDIAGRGGWTTAWARQLAALDRLAPGDERSYAIYITQNGIFLRAFDGDAETIDAEAFPTPAALLERLASVR